MRLQRTVTKNHEQKEEKHSNFVHILTTEIDLSSKSQETRRIERKLVPKRINQREDQNKLMDKSC